MASPQYVFSDAWEDKFYLQNNCYIDYTEKIAHQYGSSYVPQVYSYMQKSWCNDYTVKKFYNYAVSDVPQGYPRRQKIWYIDYTEMLFQSFQFILENLTQL